MSSLHFFARQMRKLLSGKGSFDSEQNSFNLHSQTFEKTVFAIRFFYICLFCLSVSRVVGLTEGLFLRPMDEPKWPLLLFPWPETKVAQIILAQMALLFGSAVSVLKPFYRTSRVLAFVGLFYIIAFRNSDQHHSHDMHLMMYPAFFLMFLPALKNILYAKRIEKHRTILGFWGGQLGICVAYQMAGYSKVTEIFSCLYDQGFEGCQVGTYIMTTMAAQEAIAFKWPTFAGNILYDFPFIGAVMYYGVIWVHNISIIFPFRFHLHRFFLCYRIFFHFGTLILFGISFNTSILAVVSMFAVSPFSRSFSLKQVVRSLPPLGWVVK